VGFQEVNPHADQYAIWFADKMKNWRSFGNQRTKVGWLQSSPVSHQWSENVYGVGNQRLAATRSQSCF
jgi:hypothetical protein